MNTDPRPPLIAHVDLDAFFVAVERLLDPSLVGKPVLVGGHSARAVVSAASYETRKFGCRSAMPMRQAMELCPEAMVLSGHYEAYSEHSHKVFEIMEKLAPVVEQVSIDEAYLDLSGCEGLLGAPLAAAHRIRNEVFAQTKLVISIGLGVNRTVAKISSGLAKPNGILWIPAGSERSFLAPLAVEMLPGVGPASMARLHELNIFTLGDAAARDPAELEQKLGSLGPWIHEKGLGLGSAELQPEHDAKSMGRETTFEKDIRDWRELDRVIAELAEDVGSRLRRAKMHARTVTVKIRDGKFRTITRAQSFDEPTASDDTITKTAWELFHRNWPKSRPVRLIGVTCSGLDNDAELVRKPVQPSLFDKPKDKRPEKLDSTIDQLRARFGDKAVVRGRTVRGGTAK